MSVNYIIKFGLIQSNYLLPSINRVNLATRRDAHTIPTPNFLIRRRFCVPMIDDKPFLPYFDKLIPACPARDIQYLGSSVSCRIHPTCQGEKVCRSDRRSHIADDILLVDQGFLLTQHAVGLS